MLKRHRGYLNFNDKLGKDAFLVEYELRSLQPRHCDTEIVSCISGGLYSFNMMFSGRESRPSRCSGDGQVKEGAQLQPQRAKDSISRT